MMLRLLRCVHLTWLLNFRGRFRSRVWKVFLKVLLRYVVCRICEIIRRDFWLNFWSGKLSKFHWFKLLWLGQQLILFFLVFLVNLVTPISQSKVASLRLWLNLEHFGWEWAYGWYLKLFWWKLISLFLRKHFTSTICCSILWLFLFTAILRMIIYSHFLSLNFINIVQFSSIMVMKRLGRWCSSHSSDFLMLYSCNQHFKAFLGLNK